MPFDSTLPNSSTSSLSGSPDHPPYATTAMLSQYIPEADPDHPRAKSLLGKLSKSSTVLRIQIGLAASVAAVNTAFWIWATATHDLDPRGVGTLFTGDCRRTATINTVTHLVLNGLSTLFLGAANYCMQILVAPTRTDLDLAHALGGWLEIGVLSFRNLRKLKRFKIILYLILGMVSTVLHLTWNSTLFASIPFTIFTGAIATSDLQWATDRWDNSTTRGAIRTKDPNDRRMIFGLQERAKNFTRLDKVSCLKLYVDPLKTTSDIVIVAQNITSSQNNGSSLLQGWVNGLFSDGWEYANFWVCDAETSSTTDVTRYCTLDWALSFADNWQLLTWEAPHQQALVVDYCLIGEQADNDNRCGVHFSSPAIGFVSLFTWIGFLVVVFVARLKDDKTIATIGDAMASYLEYPEKVESISDDTSGRNQYPFIKRILSGSGGYRIAIRPTLWLPSPSVTWFHAVGRGTWIMTYMVFLLGLVPLFAGVIFVLFSVSHQGVAIDISGLWKQGLGKVNGFALIQGPWHHGYTLNEFTSQLLLTNGLQLLLSFLYLLFNNIITRQLVADEWTRLLSTEEKKPLRVSAPRSFQRSTYTLSIPFKYSIPMMILFTLSHWLVSQAIFIVQTTVYQSGAANIPVPNKNSSRIGFSAPGVVLVFAIVTLMIFGLLVHSCLRKYRNVPKSFPRMATCSAAISAVCRPPEGDTDAYLFPVSMGVVMHKQPNQDSAGWLTMSTYIDLQNPRKGLIIDQPEMVTIQESLKPTRNGFHDTQRLLPHSIYE
ncbi:hypothetical protein O1611_g5572 [Lasiodiplodia mahajangana]|uniref:Uncharacterized protein n=1 Tax=Lasiodiplodia mahajangana TaxID=1108764 RepID=A0ACC2JKU4_9PEZI|nr:hypothetical protein O1611_g5572 [Lasiodiplodia mahajangana]